MNFQIELTNHCNLQCVECPQRLMKRKRQFMSLDTFHKALYDYIIPLKEMHLNPGHVPTLILHKDGEPLLHPKIMTIIDDISKADRYIKIDIYTNGTLLTEEFLKFLKTIPNPMWLLVSFHFYNAQGEPIDYRRVNELLCLVLNSKDRPQNTTFIFTSHVTRFMSEERLKIWKKDWENKLREKIDIHVNKHINPWTGLIQEENCVSFNGCCPYADFGHLFVGVSGNVVPCCMDLEEELVFGNIITDDRNDIVTKLSSFYKELSDKEINRPLCSRCLA